jgi:hypothetical protein
MSKPGMPLAAKAATPDRDASRTRPRTPPPIRKPITVGYKYKWKNFDRIVPYWNQERKEYEAKFKKVAPELSKDKKSHLHSFYAWDFQDSAAEKERLYDQLSVLEHEGFTLVDVPKDGDCFYHCIKLALGLDETAQQIRATTCAWMSGNQAKLLAVMQESG